MALDVRCTANLAAVAPDAWDALLAEAGDAAVFRSLPFLQAWQRAFCTDDCSCRLRILTVWDGVALIGAAPFYLTVVDATARAEEDAQAAHWRRVLARADGRASPPAARTARDEAAAPAAPPDAAPRVGERVVRFAGGVAVADYLDVLAVAGRAAEVWEAALGYWADHQADWDVLDLHALAPQSARLAAAAGSARGWEVSCGVEETCPYLDLPGDWDSYLAQLGKKDRHEIRRKLRRVEERDGSISWTIAADGPELAVAFEGFLELHRLSGAAKAEFMTPAMEAFFSRLTAGVRGDRPTRDRHALRGRRARRCLPVIPGRRQPAPLQFGLRSGFRRHWRGLCSAGLSDSAARSSRACGISIFSVATSATSTTSARATASSVASSAGSRFMCRIAMLSVHTCPLATLGGKETGGHERLRARAHPRTRRAAGKQVDVFTRAEDPAIAPVRHMGPNAARVIHVPAGPVGAATHKNAIYGHLDEFVAGVEAFRREARASTTT